MFKSGNFSKQGYKSVKMAYAERNTWYNVLQLIKLTAGQ